VAGPDKQRLLYHYQVMVKTTTKIEEEIAAIFSGNTPWVTIVWDDPVNLMTYVTYVLMELFGYPREKAHELMMKIHTEGKAVVSTGTREEMEHDVAMLHEYGLWATLQRGDQAL
jgi:ATP-dependent Clp protease adaptor protein ClpS